MDMRTLINKVKKNEQLYCVLLKPRRFCKRLSKIPMRIEDKQKFTHDIKEYKRKNTRKTFEYDKKWKFFLNESRKSAGTCGQYYWQDLWAAQKIISRKPSIHYDIGSRIDGFIAHLQAARQNVVLIDVRKMENYLPYVEFVQADATMLDGIKDNSIESLSALCSLEHFGLGRYGDAIDPEGCFKAMKSIQRVMKAGGILYISVPIGKEHVEFNAHRIFYPQTIIDTFSEMKLVEFKVNTLEEKMTLKTVENIHEFDYEYNNGVRFGLFEFVKKEI